MKDARQKASAALAKSTKRGTLAGLKQTDVQSVFESLKPQISQALPRHLSADRIIAMATQTILKNPKIAECSATSLIGAIMQSSILGFKPTDSLGQVYFIPYGGHVQMQIGYKGYVDLARRSGQIKSLFAYTVHENDEFEYELGLYPTIRHKPASGDRGKFTHVYAVSHYNNGGYNFVVLSYDDVERLRLRNHSQRAKASGPWATDFSAMAQAKAIKQLAKFMPISDELQGAIISDEAVISTDSFANDQSGTINDDSIHAEYEDITDDSEDGMVNIFTKDDDDE